MRYTIIILAYIMCLNNTQLFCMNLTQNELQQIYSANGFTVTFNNTSWERSVKKKSYGDEIVILTPNENCYFLRTYIEISYDTKEKKFKAVTLNLPTDPVAFVLGSVLVGTALYFLLKKSHTVAE